MSASRSLTFTLLDSSFCYGCPETVHLFWHCPIVKDFWLDFCVFITENIDESFILLWNNVLFGLLENNTTTNNNKCR